MYIVGGRRVCHHPVMPHRFAYSGTPLDRAAAQRTDHRWLRQQAAANPLVLVTWQDRNLVAHAVPDNVDPEAVFLGDDAARAVLRDVRDHAEVMFLGLQDETPVFSVDLSAMDEADALTTVGYDAGGHVQFTDLRTVGQILDRQAGSLLAFARGMAYWHRRHRYCGACGSATRSVSGGFIRSCMSDACRLDHFPRTDPAVIMLVTADLPDGEHCLLGRKAGWAEGHYSSLAGFVEPGESLETAVAREVMEESSIAVTDVRYQASQPWPFPSSLMLGFRARAVTYDIDADDELEDVRWFSRDELHERAQKNAADGKLSRPDSIARWLIEDWMNEHRDE